MLDNVKATKDYDGVLGKWSFDADGDTSLTEMSGLIVKGGGHAMAAGLTIKKAALETFQSAFIAVTARWLDASAQGVIESDGNRLIHVACGSVETSERADLGTRLVAIHDGLLSVIEPTLESVGVSILQ